MPLTTKVLLGLVLLLLTQIAFAQKNLGELFDAGARKVSPEEFRQDVVQRVLVGTSPVVDRIELMYASSGVIQGSYTAPPGSIPGSVYLAQIDGAWTIDDSGRICTSMVIGRTILPFRCQYWFKLKDDYFVADSDSDRGAKVLRRTVKR